VNESREHLDPNAQTGNRRKSWTDLVTDQAAALSWTLEVSWYLPDVSVFEKHAAFLKNSAPEKWDQFNAWNSQIGAGRTAAMNWVKGGDRLNKEKLERISINEQKKKIDDALQAKELPTGHSLPAL
jgi:hypothetical protein